MSAAKLNRKSDDEKVTEFISNTFEKRECNRFRNEANETECCECGYSKDVHSSEDLHSESDQSTRQNRPTIDAFGKLTFFVDEEDGSYWKNIRYVRLDHKTDENKISKFLYDVWKMDEPDVILSVVSDSDCFSDKGNEVNETASYASVQNTRKTICRNLVEAAAATNAWIITGGLNKGVDQLIGNEVKQRLAKSETIPQVVLGISNWGCLEEKRSLLNNSRVPIDNGFSLNQHHTHFLLVDDGTQKKSGCECKLREKVELALMKWKTNDEDRKLSTCSPFIYILIGGSINAFSFVENALAHEIPVLIATGTGGAADIISGELSSKE